VKILLSWSTGKDSAWALHVLRQQYPDSVAALLTTTNEAFDRVAMHAVRRELLEAQAAATGLPLTVVPLPWPCSNEEYERRMAESVAGFVAAGFTHAAFGDLFLEDVRRYRESRLAVSTSLGTTSDAAGSSSTSSKVRPSRANLSGRLSNPSITPRRLRRKEMSLPAVEGRLG